jgi:hypothetical protein
LEGSVCGSRDHQFLYSTDVGFGFVFEPISVQQVDVTLEFLIDQLVQGVKTA